ncbi:unnamed protein product [Cylicostephanus goldi]|uniref:Uncharacterized protein n=1 Tax=Cylicostephanus goldi TaxID=71465 RepID=A0A3P6RXV4_CYLGO|nr:unnamed protein product [Cylicostephanus goldi]
MEPSKSAVNKVAGLFVSLFGKTSANELPEKWSTTYKSILKLSKYIEKNENSPGTRVYNTRIYDLVIDGKGTQQSSEVNLPPFLQSAFDIVKSFNGAKNARVLSPRFAPLLPDRTSTKGFLSPSIFPFYKDDTEQQILPVPKMLESAGMNGKDRERLLEMIMEVSGARDTVDKAMKAS